MDYFWGRVGTRNTVGMRKRKSILAMVVMKEKERGEGEEKKGKKKKKKVLINTWR